MTMHIRTILPLFLLLALAWHEPAHGQDAASGQAVFQAQCSVCHSAAQGQNMTGPSLFGVVGRRAGTVAGFDYSAANKASAMTWTVATLDLYLTSPTDTVPHNAMIFGGLKDAQRRADLIAYLATLR
jgi:cytochrome c